MSAQIIFIIWRESVEALLVIGILQSWLRHNAPRSHARRYLWGGVGAGAALAVLLGWAILRLAEWLPAEDLDYFMAAMMAVAAALIVQMVLWMRAHGRNLRHNLEDGLDAAVQHRRWWGVFTLALIAVAREGSETVIFLFGLLASGGNSSKFAVAAAIGLGFGAALATYALIQASSRFLSWRVFFKATEVMLLLLGCALSLSAVDRLISLGVLPYTRVVWDSSWLLDDRGTIGGLVAALTGYRATPDVLTLVVWVIYGAVIAAAMWLQNRHHSPQQTV